MVDVVGQASRARGGYVEWGAVLAGAVLAAALSFVLLTFGTGIGLSLLSPYPPESYGRAAASIAALWILIVPIASFLLGGYVTGRLRSAWDGADEAEVEFRDGIHGALVWGISIVFGALLAFFAATAAAHTGAMVVTATADKGALFAPALDTLFAPVTIADNTAPQTGTPIRPTPGAVTPANRVTTDDREAAQRTIASAIAVRRLGTADRTYLAGIVSQRTGLSAAEAEKRVDQSYAQALEAADKARKGAVVTAFLTGAALLIGLAGAWYAAQRGGHHRDENIPARFTWAYRPTLTQRTTTKPKNLPSD